MPWFDDECRTFQQWLCGIFLVFVAALCILLLASCGTEEATWTPGTTTATPMISSATATAAPAISTPRHTPSPMLRPTQMPTVTPTATLGSVDEPDLPDYPSPTSSPTSTALTCADLAGGYESHGTVVVSFAPGLDCDARVGVHYRWRVGTFPDGDPAYAQGGVECPYDQRIGEYRAILPDEATHWRFSVTALDGSTHDSPWYSVAEVS